MWYAKGVVRWKASNMHLPREVMLKIELGIDPLNWLFSAANILNDVDDMDGNDPVNWLLLTHIRLRFWLLSTKKEGNVPDNWLERIASFRNDVIIFQPAGIVPKICSPSIWNRCKLVNNATSNGNVPVKFLIPS